MSDDTVIDGAVVALDPDGRPSFNLLQNYGSSGAPLHFFVFDLLVLKGEDVMTQPLVKRRQLLEKHILPKLEEPIRYSPILVWSKYRNGFCSKRLRLVREIREMIQRADVTRRYETSRPILNVRLTPL
jgi:ATP-dependent DNA ligase